jgi:hypothetical protein
MKGLGIVQFPDWQQSALSTGASQPNRLVIEGLKRFLISCIHYLQPIRFGAEA